MSEPPSRGTSITVADALRMAAEREAAGRPGEAEAILRAVLGAAPGQPDALHRLGLLHGRAGRLEEGLRVLRVVVAVAPGAGVLHRTMATFLEGLERAGAADAWRRAALLDPFEPNARLRLSERLAQEVRPRAAAAAARGAAACAPALPGAWLRLAEAAALGGALDTAETAAARAVRLDPADGLGHRLLGAARLGQGRTAAAAADFARALERLPGDVHAAEGQRRSRIVLDLARSADAPEAPRGVVVRGPFRDTSGYSFMVRRFLLGLRDHGLALQIAGTLWGPELDAGTRDPWFDHLGAPVNARVALHFELPDWLLPIPGLVNVNLSMTEFDRVPPAWVERARWHDLLILPTESSRDAWIAAGMPADRIRICPLGCDPPEADLDAPPPALTLPDGRPLASVGVRMLNVASLTPRKNLEGLLRAWARATGPQDDAALVLKLGKGDEGARTQDALAAALAAAGVEPGAAAPILPVADKLSDRAMAGLFRAATHYVSLSRGEGWDLPMGMAGSLGLTLVAPDHSAYRTYLTPETAHLVPVRPAPVPWEGEHRAGWWEPDADAAADTLRRIVAGTAPPKASARDHLLARFRWTHAAARLAEILEEAATLAPRAGRG